MATGDDRLAEVNRELQGGNVKWGAFSATRVARGEASSFGPKGGSAGIERREESDAESFSRVRTSRSH